MNNDGKAKETIKKLTTLVDGALKKVKSMKIDGAEIFGEVSEGYSVSVRNGKLETVEHHHNNSVGVTVYNAAKKGNANSGDIREATINQAIEKAAHIANYTQPDQFSGLADVSLMAQNIPNLDLYHPWTIDVADAIDIALQCEQTGLDVTGISNSEGATVNVHSGYAVYGNTHGFIGENVATNHSISCILITEDNGLMQRDYYYTINRVPEKLLDPITVGELAADRTLKRLGGRSLKTQKAPIIFAPEMAKSLVGHFVSAIKGSNQYRKASFLLDQIEKPVMAKHMNIAEKPHLLQQLGSAAFDAEGVATYDRSIVSDGILNGYVLDSYSAKKLNMKTTGNAGGVHNLVLASNTMTNLSNLMQEIKTGLYITELMGQGVNMITGDYSRGASGYWIENGEIAFPVHEVTIAGNLKDMLNAIIAISDDIDYRSKIHTGSIAVDNMTIAGNA